MQITLLMLLVSFFAANSMHFYLLYRQRHDRKPTISHHAAKSTRTYFSYIAGHVVASTTFYIFALGFFVNTPQAEILITVATIGWVTDIIQALIPAKGRVEKYHEIAACIMAVSVIVIGVLAAFTIPQLPIASVISKLLAVCLALSIPVSRIIDFKYFYRIQMISLLIFYIEMFAIILGG